MTILSEILEDVQARVEKEKKSKLQDNEYNWEKKSLKDSIRNEEEISIISEVKKASPTAGKIKSDLDIKKIVKDMVSGGVVGISVLTEPKYFDGSFEYLGLVKETVNVPILCKDFIIDTYQIFKANKMGADAILLISDLLGENLYDFIEKAREKDLECLVEVKDREDANLALEADADLIGINNRNLDTMKIDLSRTEQLISHFSEDQIIVSESGISTKRDIKRVEKVGADAVLVGTSIMKSENSENKVRELKKRD